MRLKLDTYTIINNPTEFKRIIRYQLGMRWISGHLSHKVTPDDGQYPLALVNTNWGLALISNQTITSMDNFRGEYKYINTSES